MYTKEKQLYVICTTACNTFLDITYKAPPSLHDLPKSGGDRPRGLRDYAPKPFAPEIVGGGEAEAP